MFNVVSQAAAGRALYDTATMDRPASAGAGSDAGGSASAALLERTQVVNIYYSSSTMFARRPCSF